MTSTLCGHINPDFTMCNRKSGYNYSTRCKKHIKDIGGTKSGEKQMELLLKIRGINTRLVSERIPLLPVSADQLKLCEIMIRPKRK